MLAEDVSLILKEARKTISAPDVIVDPYDLTFVWVSEKMCKITGFSSEELISNQIFKAAAHKPEDAGNIESMMMYTPNMRVVYIPIKTKEGRLIKLKSKVNRVIVDGQPYAIAKLLGNQK